MKKIRFNKNKGILIWITGYSGSGKTTIAKKIHKRITKELGKTLLISGDDLRKIFELNKFTKKDRIANGIKFSKLCENITNQKINIIFAVVGLFKKIRNRNRRKIENYIEVYIKSDIKKIIRIGKKKIYNKHTKNIVGKDINAELPKKPEIIIENNFKKSVSDLADQLIKKVVTICKN